MQLWLNVLVGIHADQWLEEYVRWYWAKGRPPMSLQMATVGISVGKSFPGFCIGIMIDFFQIFHP